VPADRCLQRVEPLKDLLAELGVENKHVAAQISHIRFQIDLASI
jgi:hypothetical protein